MEEKTWEELKLENEALRERLREAEEVIGAIREGRVDALVSYEPEGERVYTLESADRGYRALVESIHEGALILATDGSIYYANPRFEEMLQGDRIVGSSLIEYIAEADRKQFEAILAEALTGCCAKGEVRLQAADGTLTPVAFASCPLVVNGFGGLCVTLTDLTEQKHYIERLERSNRELQDFASIASHDLQEPLRKIQAFGERLKTRCANCLPPEGEDYLNRMQKASERMQGFIRELLNYSRVTSRGAPFLPVDLSAVLWEVVGDLQVRIEETGGTVEIGALPAIEADAGQMRQLFLNLIGNALKFHGADKPFIRVSAADESRTCRIAVEDNGIGFEEKDAERIFAPFQRLQGRSAYEGTGMGLAICKKIVERHGGTITARSTPGKGSTFTVTLPRQQQKGGVP